MTQQGEIVKTTPGKNLIAAGAVIAILGVVLSIMATMSTHVDKYGIETQGTPAPAAIVMIVAGLLLAGVGFARRMLATR